MTNQTRIQNKLKADYPHYMTIKKRFCFHRTHIFASHIRAIISLYKLMLSLRRVLQRLTKLFES